MYNVHIDFTLSNFILKSHVPFVLPFWFLDSPYLVGLNVYKTHDFSYIHH